MDPTQAGNEQAPGGLRIGGVVLDSPVVQAALSGYSDTAMRLVARRLGAPYTLCEVMLDQFVVQVRHRKRTRHIMHVDPEEHPVGGQLMGAVPEQFGPAAQRLVERGFDVVDINFGCPVRKVLGRCRGGFHLSQPEDGAGDRFPRARGNAPVGSCDGEDAARGSTPRPRAWRTSTRSSRGRSTGAWRRSPCTGGPSSRNTRAPRTGASSASSSVRRVPERCWVRGTCSTLRRASR